MFAAKIKLQNFKIPKELKRMRKGTEKEEQAKLFNRHKMTTWLLLFYNSVNYVLNARKLHLKSVYSAAIGESRIKLLLQLL
jgi:hypothetical protein